MIYDSLKHNEEVTPNSLELNTLRENFPQYFDKDGQFMLGRFSEMLRINEMQITKEGYELKFLGKSYAKYQAGLETETVIVPDLEHNSKPENKDSENLYIVGDNLDALQHLVKSYTGQVKCIYIDPPYNTGSDGFVYQDDFGFTVEQLVKKIGMDEEEARRILDMQGKSSHSAWLTFMYPRLILARELLSDDGVIFISIDDNEQANLKLLCDDVFGEQCFVAEIGVRTNPKGRSQDMYIAKCHEYLLCYSSTVLPKGSVSIDKTDIDILKDYKLIDKTLGPYRELELRNTHRQFGKHNRSNLYYPLFAASSGEVSIIQSEKYNIEVLPIWDDGYDGCWTWDQKKAEENIHLLVAHKVRSTWKVYRKSYAYVDGEVVSKKVKSLWTEKDMRTEQGQSTFDNLFESKEKLFEAPKPVSLISRAINMGSSRDSIILDFFSGFRVIIVIEANSYVNIRSSRLLPKFKTQKINSWCAA